MIEESEAENVLTMTVTSPGGNAEIWVPVSEGRTVSVLAGTAEALGVKEAYHGSYKVFAAKEAGTYVFEARGEAPEKEDATKTDAIETGSPEPAAAQPRTGLYLLIAAVVLILAAAVVIWILRKNKHAEKQD